MARGGDKIAYAYVDVNSQRDVEKMLEKLLAGSRRAAPNIVKDLARKAANSAAKLTIPRTSGAAKGVRRPKLKDKFRPLVDAKTQLHGQFYVVNKSQNSGKRKNKKRKRKHGFSGTKAERRVMAGSRGELVIYTTKKISQKDERFQRIKKLIQAWDKKANKFKYIPTTTRGKYEKDTRAGKIPHYFTAKQAWLWSVRSISKRFIKLNPSATKRGRMTNKLSRQDKPGVILHNNSNYAHKKGGYGVPRKALVLAMRGYQHQLEKQKQKIIAKAKRG